MEHHYWGNVDYPSNVAAKVARDAEALRLRRLGHKVRRSVLTGQCRPYAGLGQPDGTVGNIYILRVEQGNA